MFGKKAQGTTEYLIILSVIIVIALVVVGVMGWFPGLGTTITEQQSKAFWQAASPLAITSWNIGTTDGDLVLRNQTTDTITVKEITFVPGGAFNVTAQGITIPPGSTATFTSSGATPVNCTTSGQPYSFDVTIDYDVADGLSAATQSGTKPLVGICVTN